VQLRVFRGKHGTASGCVNPEASIVFGDHREFFRRAIQLQRACGNFGKKRLVMSSAIANIELLQLCETQEQLAATISGLAAELGFEHWMYGLDLPVIDDRKQQYMLGGYPTEWVDHYFVNEYLRLDPVIAHCQAHSTPLLWPSTNTPPTGSDKRNRAVWRMFNEAREFGLDSGISIPVHGLGCRWGLMSFAAKTPMSLQDLQHLVPHLHLLAHCIHDVGRRYAPGIAPPATAHLTAREIECLHWVAAGKTSWEIGRLLSVAERTVVFHLQNATHKLGVSGRQAAIARAIVAGLITP
jgi:DNA-binding CsgD family transcriptional regulator